MIAVYLPAEFRDIDDDATPEEEAAVLSCPAAAAVIEETTMTRLPAPEQWVLSTMD